MIKVTESIKNLTEMVDSRLDTHYRIGMRVVKSAAAVMICLLISLLFKGWDTMAIAAVSAIVTIRPTRVETMSSGMFRVIGTIFGGAVGILTVFIGLFLPYYNEGLFVVVIPLMLLLNMYVCNVLKMQDSCTISCVVTILVAAHVNRDASVGSALIFTLFRVSDTLIGVVVATVMNILPYHVVVWYKKARGIDVEETSGADGANDEEAANIEDANVKSGADIEDAEVKSGAGTNGADDKSGAGIEVKDDRQKHC